MADALQRSRSLLALINGYQASRCLYVAAYLDLAEHMADGPMHYAELARVTATNADALHRLIRFLTTYSVFFDEGNGRFSNGPLGERLRRGDPYSLRAGALLFGGTTQDAWQQLLHTIKTGEPAYPRVFGTNTFRYRQEHKEEAENFDVAMSNLTLQTAHALIQAYDLTNITRIVDVGGGNGAFVAHLLRSHACLTATVFDQPDVAIRAEEHLASQGLAGRAQAMGGDFFKTIPSGADLYILKNVLHDWSDEHVAEILRCCSGAMSPRATLLVVEEIKPKKIDESFTVRRALSSDLNMLVCTGGRQRSADDFRSLLSGATLRLTRVIPTATSVSVVEAKRL